MFGDRFNNVTDRKTGAFQDWTEDQDTAELFLPLPRETLKKELVCTITADKLHVWHSRLKQTLLKVEPLAGLIHSEESTWYLQGGSLLVITLTKQRIGATNSDQYWGASLAKKDGGLLECYKSPADVEHAREARERKQKRLDEEHHARVKASEQALKDQEQEEAQRAAQKARRRRAAAALAEGEEADAIGIPSHEGGRPEASSSWPSDYSWIWMGFAMAAVFILLDVMWNYRSYFGENGSPISRNGQDN
jgi:hypothetical protein